jgi:hypothetical protein
MGGATDWLCTQPCTFDVWKKHIIGCPVSNELATDGSGPFR